MLADFQPDKESKREREQVWNATVCDLIGALRSPSNRDRKEREGRDVRGEGSRINPVSKDSIRRYRIAAIVNE